MYVGTQLDGPWYGLGSSSRPARWLGVLARRYRAADPSKVGWRRSQGGLTWTFVLNHSDSEVEVPVGAAGTNLRDGERVDGRVRVGPVDVAIVRSE